MKTIVRFIMAITTLMAATAASAQVGNEMKYTPQATTFSLTTLPTTQAVTLRLYNEGIGGKPFKTIKMTADKGKTLWKATVKGDMNGKFYTFEVKVNGKLYGETPGIWAKAVGVNGKRGAIIDMKATDPAGWKADMRPAIAAKDLILYEMHHRDFSAARNINLDPQLHIKRVSSNYPGKFMALTEDWAINHLKELGVNAVHILPSFDYASVDETKLDKPQYNWGYDPVNYNVPEGSYSTNPYKPEVRINEFKQMVQALHKAGIKVILDVVYNHTFDIDGSAFQRTMPDYFYRKNADGSYSNGSGCGNETASDQPLMRQFMVESVKYWVDEYHIDGFRFDLMGIHDIETMNAIRKALPDDIFIYGEGWSAGSCAYPYEKLGMKAHIQQMPGIAAFSDEIRDGLRGPWDGDDKAAFLGAVVGNEESVKYGIVGAISHPQVDMKKVNYSKEAWANQPTQMISYVSCHDDMCLVDRLKASIPGISESELIRLDLLGQTAVLTSQGVPFLLSGEELLRNKKGVHNSFESPDSINQLNWNNRFKYPQVFNYYRDLIALRKHHPAFHMGDADLVRKHLEFLPTEENVVAYRLKNHAGGDTWNNIYVVLNGSRKECVIDVPQGRYTVVANCGFINEKGLDIIEDSQVRIPSQTALIMHD
ncbi:MAG: type I pullulanase [Muribaculaceae bacterium]|nr:type I pullulanase [Muribaculaceae bacterium]